MRSTADPAWAEVMAFYRTSFPPCEQRCDEDYAAALADPAFRAAAIRRDDRTVGLLFYWRCGGAFYIEHLAVSPLCGASISGPAYWRSSVAANG